MTFSRTSSFLRGVLLADAAACAVSGLLMAFDGGALAGPLGVPAAALTYVGLVLLPVAAFVAYVATRETLHRPSVWAVVVCNALWAVDSVALLLTGWVAPTQLGTAVVLLGTGLLPARIAQFIRDFGHGEDLALHLIQEMGALMLLAGLVCLWCVRHYDRSRYSHWALTAFWAIWSLIHWLGHDGHLHTGLGPVVNAVPLTLFLIVGVLRMKRAPVSG